MVDYYTILLRAVTAPGAGDAQWRSDIYDRARQMLSNQMRSRRSRLPMAEIVAEQAALEAAIEKIEAELAWTDRGATARESDERPQAANERDIASDITLEAERGPIAERRSLSGTAWLAIAVVAAVVGAGGYAFWAKTARKAPLPVKTEAPAAAAKTAREVATTKDGDLPPGVDGGSSDPDLQYVFRRQPTFYRTLQPVGTIIIDKLQHLLYLIQPNNVALRYGIGIGEQCIDLAGLHRVTHKAEWPPWEPPPEIVTRRLAKAGTLPGGPGNPLGARILELDDGKSSIHGTNAPKTIGSSVTIGCIRLANDDIVDLYGRVAEGTSVILQ